MSNSSSINIAPRSAEWRERLRQAMSAKERAAIPRVSMPELPASFRVTFNYEVNQGI